MLKWVEKYIQLFEFAIHGKMMREKINRYESYFKGKVIDVGAGDQPYRKLFKSASKYIATNTKKHYKDKLDDVDQYTDVWIEDASTLPFDDNSADGILCFQVLSVIQKPELFFKETDRILIPGGKLLLTTDFLYPTWSKSDKARYSIQQLERFAKEAGLNVLKSESFGGFKSLMFSLISRRGRSYPERIKSASTLFGKFFRSFVFLTYLIFLPIISISGFIIYLVDKKNRDDFDFTFNLLLFAEKPLKK
ncbi:MAG: methyltransferase domain-containing protein [Bacteroidota bacterium]